VDEESRPRALATILKILLETIKLNDTDYPNRYGLVLRALTVAHNLGLGAGIRIDPEEPDWPVAYIELPTGQVSWHMPQHPVPFDGHDTEEKYRRIWEYVNG
jgi:hypothetical protein